MLAPRAAREPWVCSTGKRQLVLSDLAKRFGELTARAAGRVDLVGLGIVNDLPGRQVVGGDQREMLGEGGGDREVARGDDPERSAPRPWSRSQSNRQL